MAAETQTIMCINGGSSSLKFHLYEMGPSGRGLSEQLLAHGAVEGIGYSKGRVWFRDGQGNSMVDSLRDEIGFEGAVEEAMNVLSSGSLPSVEAVGHRVVHGGPERHTARVITPDVLGEMQEHVAWAPLHMPTALRVIDAMETQLPGLPQVACFDTGFHSQLPEVAQRLPLPAKFYDQGIRRYGFHGLSYEYIIGELGDDAAGKVVIAHLGSGCSMVACVDGESVDTTMGMTPLGGLMMGTRSGDVDPGILLYLMREWGYDADMLERVLDRESGLRGVSDRTGSMEKLLELRAGGNAGAALAVEMFCYEARKTIGSLAAVMGGMDRLVFTAGIGEKAPLIRALICRGLEHLGIELDLVKNNEHARTISGEQSRCQVHVIPTNEDLIIARHTYRLVFGGR